MTSLVGKLLEYRGKSKALICYIREPSREAWIGKADINLTVDIRLRKGLIFLVIDERKWEPYYGVAEFEDGSMELLCLYDSSKLISMKVTRTEYGVENRNIPWVLVPLPSLGSD